MYSKHELAVVSKMYYKFNYTQSQIAHELGYSRPKISRMLRMAIDQRIVTINIQEEPMLNHELEMKIKKLFSLENVVVYKTFYKNESLIKDELGGYIADFLIKNLKPKDVLGVSWGTTLSFITEHLNIQANKNIKIVQLNGGISNNLFQTGSLSLLESFSSVLASEYHYIPAPSIVDSIEIANTLMQDTIIKKILNLGNKANVALFSIGEASKSNIIYKSGYFSDEEFNNLIAKGAVGDICSRYFDINGEVVDKNLNKRTIGVKLDELKTKEKSIGVAVGKRKARAVLGAIKGQYINHLFVDDNLANTLIKLEEEENESDKII